MIAPLRSLRCQHCRLVQRVIGRRWLLFAVRRSRRNGRRRNCPRARWGVHLYGQSPYVYGHVRLLITGRGGLRMQNSVVFSLLWPCRHQPPRWEKMLTGLMKQQQTHRSERCSIILSTDGRTLDRPTLYLWYVLHDLIHCVSLCVFLLKKNSSRTLEHRPHHALDPYCLHSKTGF